MVETEHELAAVASALIGDHVWFSVPDRWRVRRARTIPAPTLSDIREAIRAGEDPLGEAFCRIRSPQQRRGHGATYTPKPIVDAMIAWAAETDRVPQRIVDPGAGSGRFLIAASRAFPKAELIAVEVDPLAALMTHANAAILGFAERLVVKLVDYRELTLPMTSGTTLFVGNPPYVRHHDINRRWKAWYGAVARSFGIPASRLAGLHLHFFLKTRQLARPGDYGVFITAAEWLDVNYGLVLRRMLADGLGGTAVHVIDPKALPFPGTFATGAITCFRVGRRPNQLTVRIVDSLEKLAPLSQGSGIAWRELELASRWSPLLRGGPEPRHGDIELGEIFSVHRGQVTGCNAVWIAGPEAANLPARYLFPAVTKARELLTTGEVLATARALKKVVDLPLDLDEMTAVERAQIDEFLAWARRMKAHQSFIATHRRAWWSVGLKHPAAILCTYMARRAPAFVLNRVGARHLNIAHGLYPRGPLSDGDLQAILAYLRLHTGTAGGRVYAGGLVKFEPKELERIRLPRLEDIHGQLAEEKSIAEALVARRAASRRPDSDAWVSE